MVRAGVPGIALRLFGTREVGHTHARTDARTDTIRGSGGGGQSWEVEAGRVAQAPQALKRLKRSTRTLKRLSGLRWEVEPPRIPEAA